MRLYVFVYMIDSKWEKGVLIHLRKVSTPVSLRNSRRLTWAETFLHFKPFPKPQILDSSKLKEFADDNFRFDENDRKFSRKFSKQVKKHCGEKRKNCSLRAFSTFSHSIFKRLVLQTRKNQGLFRKGLNCLRGIR